MPISFVVAKPLVSVITMLEFDIIISTYMYWLIQKACPIMNIEVLQVIGQPF